MWCGQSATWLGNSRRRGEALIRQIRRTFPALGGIKAEYAWTGVAGETVHGMPQIGEITPGMWLMGGFGSHGIAASAMAGEILARAIVDTDRAWQMFSPFPLIWAGGVAGRVAQQASVWWRRRRESVEQSLARRRAKREAGQAPAS
jgi:glycine/D-amino acid oxidase-like deaminating enzyme